MLFISYSTKDKNEAESICQFLEASGIDYWVSHERLSGEDNWPSEISHAIHQCTSFLILLSKNVEEKPDQIVQELAIANDLQRSGLKIFGISLDGDTFWMRPGGFEYVLRSKQVRDCSQGAQQEIEKLVSLIRAYEESCGEGIGRDVAAAYERVSEVDGSSSEFLDFSVRVLAELYAQDGIEPVSYSGRTFPDVVFPAAEDVRGFDRGESQPLVQSKCSIDFAHHPPEQPVEDSLAAQVANVFARLPVNYLCYMNKGIELDAHGRVKGIEMFAGSRKQNVMTTSTLRNEFYLAYSAFRSEGRLDEVTSEDVLEMSPRRKLSLERCGRGIASVLLGAAGYVEFGVQGIALMRVDPKRTDGSPFKYRAHAGEYWTPVLKRSAELEEQPGLYQFAPCGGFGAIESPTSELSQLIVSGNFDLFNALLYRYCDELFASSVAPGGKAMPAAYGGRQSLLRGGDTLFENAHYIEMVNLIESGRARIEFLGVSSSLISLKSDLVFAIVIDDDDYFRRNQSDFAASKETSYLTFLPLSVVANGGDCIEPNMAEEICGPLELLKRSSLWEQIGSRAMGSSGFLPRL